MLFLYRTPLQAWYSITYMYWSLIGTLVTVIVGTLVSWATAAKSDEFEAKLLHPCIVKLSRCLPGKPRIFKMSTDSSESSATIATMVTQNGAAVSPAKLNGAHENFAFDVENGSAKKSNRLNNMLSRNTLNTNELTTGQDEEQVAVYITSELAAVGQGSGTRSMVVLGLNDESQFSPETTGVYKRMEHDC